MYLNLHAPYTVYGWMDTAVGKTGLDLQGEHLATVWLDYCGTWNVVWKPEDAGIPISGFGQYSAVLLS